MIDLLLIPASAIANRFRGGGVYGGERIKYRKLVSGIALALLAAILAKNPWVFPIILGGWYIANLVGTGDGFAAIHGGYDGVRKYNVWNRWVYWAADKVASSPILHLQEPELKSDTAKHNCRWGRWFMTFRGLYIFPTAITFTFLFQNPPDVLWGLMGALSGLCYYLGGRVSKKNAVCVAEYLNGAIYGMVLFAILS